MVCEDRHGERGVALITALLSTLILLGLGLALLSVVDVQAGESANERTRDQNFNLSESVLTSQGFVMGRSWPEKGLGGKPVCSATGAGFGDTVGVATGSTAAAERLRKNITQGYAADPQYAGATWQVNLCDDTIPSSVWTDALLNNPNYDLNDNDRMWVRAQSVVKGKKRVVVGLVRVRRTPALNSRYALTAGAVADDLGATIDGLSNNVLGGVLGGPNGLLKKTATVAPDPLSSAPKPNGMTGVRCGLLDLSLGSTCLSGTLAAAGALPVLKDVLGSTTETLSGQQRDLGREHRPAPGPGEGERDLHRGLAGDGARTEHERAERGGHGRRQLRWPAPSRGHPTPGRSRSSSRSGRRVRPTALAVRGISTARWTCPRRRPTRRSWWPAAA